MDIKDCLEHCHDITCVDDEDGKGFVIQFKFGPNDYFSDSVLTKSYKVPNLLLSDEPLLKHVQGCVIHWKKDADNNDRCLTHRKIQKKQRGKGKKAGQIRTVTKTEKRESFFHWFETPPTMPADIEQMDEEEVDDIEEQFTDDFEIAQALRSEVCPRAVIWFTGEVRAHVFLRPWILVEGFCHFSENTHFLLSIFISLYLLVLIQAAERQMLEMMAAGDEGQDGAAPVPPQDP